MESIRRRILPIPILMPEHTRQFFNAEPFFILTVQGQNVSFKHLGATIYPENSAQCFNFVLKPQEINCI